MTIQMFAKGSLSAYDAHRGLVYGTEAIQKWLPVTLDTYFLDPASGAYCSRAISCTTDGFVTMEWIDGSTATMPMFAGQWYPATAFRIQTSGTTATGIFWGY